MHGVSTSLQKSPSQPPLWRSKDADPLSFAQQRLWFLDQINPGYVSANISRAVRITGGLNIEALRQALQAVVARHEMLRTTFAKTELDADVDSQPRQLIAIGSSVEFRVTPLSQFADSEREQRAREVARDEAQRPFDLTLGPLVRLTLLSLNEREYILLLNTHHIICDDFSTKIFFDELWECYRAFVSGEPARLAALAVNYRGYCLWQREWLQGERLAEQVDYWKGRLAGAPAVIELPTDRPRPAIRTWHGMSAATVVEKHLTECLRALSEREHTTLFTVLLTTFQLLLARYSKQNDIVVGSTVANRDGEATQRLIGAFANVLVLRTDVSGSPVFRELLERVHTVVVEAQAHQSIPFERLVEEFPVERSLSHEPIFQVMLNLRKEEDIFFDQAGLNIEPFPLETGISRFDLTLDIVEEKEQLNCRLEYKSDLFDEDTISRMLGHWRTLLEGVVRNPNQTIGLLPILTEAEERQIVVEWNNTQAHSPSYQCLQEQFEEQVLKTPAAIAAIFGEVQVTYNELNRRANQLAHFLRRKGVGPNICVGLCMQRSTEMITGMLGILKAGGAYIPLNPEHPPSRLAFQLAQSEAHVCLTNDKGIAESLEFDGETIDVETDCELLQREPATDLQSITNPDDLVYLIYTSGSTGVPKGVAVRHRNLNNYTQFILQKLQIDRPLNFATVSTFTADLAHTCIFPSLLSGGCLHMLSYEEAMDGTLFSAYLSRHPIDVLKIVPSHLNALLAASNGCKTLPSKYLILGGEALSWELVDRLRALIHTCKIINHYGPTETTVGSLTFSLDDREDSRSAQTVPLPSGQLILGGEVPSWELVDPLSAVIHTCKIINEYGPTETTVGSLTFGLDHHEDSRYSQTVPIGRPIANTQVYILDESSRSVPIGISGELYIGGAGVAAGYLNQPAETAQRFVPDPFSGDDGSRLYRTGDLARYLADGNIEFLGRVDQQVKIRGYRVELGEIEAVLSEHPQVSQAVVVVRRKQEDEKLVAYLTACGPTPPGQNELRRLLKQKLPDYMVPSAVVMLEAMPLTSNGKIDRHALPEPGESRPDLAQAYLDPRDQIEEQLAMIWAKVLGLNSVGVNDNFFEVGGHSLLAARLFSEIENRFGRNLPLATLFQRPTIAQLAEELRSGETQGKWSSLMAIQPNGSRPPLFCVHAGGANVLIYRPLARHLGKEQPVYALQAQGLDGQTRPFKRVEDMAAKYIEEMRGVQPHGPYFLLGASFGGLVIFEMAHQLLAQGQKVGLVAVLNTDCPVSGVVHRLRCHMGYLKQRGPRSYLRGLQRSVISRLRRKLAPTENIETEDDQLREILESREDKNDPLVRTIFGILEASRKYRPTARVYPGKITLFWANDAERDLEDNRLGWKRLASGGFEIHFVPGTHTSMREEPNVAVLAEKVALCLEKAQAD